MVRLKVVAEAEPEAEAGAGAGAEAETKTEPISPVAAGGAERCVGSCDRNGSAEDGAREVGARTAAVGSCWKRGRQATYKVSGGASYIEGDEGDRGGREHKDVLH